MEPGDLRFRSLTSSAFPGDNPLDRRYLLRVQKLLALALLILGGILLFGAKAGWAKDKRPTSRTVSGVVMDEGENLYPGRHGGTEGSSNQEGAGYLLAERRASISSQTSALTTTTRYRPRFNGLSSEVRQVSSIDTRWTLVLNLTLLKPTK